MRHDARIRIAGVGLALTLLFAAPLAAALPVGVDGAGVGELKAAGGAAEFGQVWVGTWTKGNWDGFSAQLRTLRDSGATPVILWYYWGDGISVDAVKNGKGGKSKAEWDAMANTLATRAKDAMGGKSFLVVLEPEFNKNGISSWEAFDGYLADQARLIKGIAPSAKVVVGFGSWGGYDLFDRAMAASDMSGFQYMRASTRHSASEAVNAADSILATTKQLKAKWGKPVLLFDLAIGSYGGWESVQERALQGIAAKASQLSGAGLKGIVWRYVRDNHYSSGYFGAAESTWGLKTGSGGAKPGWDDLVRLSTGGSPASAPAPASEPEPSAPSAPDATARGFSHVKGNEWWIEATVSGNPTKVIARVDGGSEKALSRTSWGSWAVSTHAPQGSVVELRATYADGKQESAKYTWPDAKPVGANAPSPGGTFSASFENAKGNEWWVQVTVKSSQDVQRVQARVDGGPWVDLQKQSWGDWAKSIKAPHGSKVEFQAIGPGGATARSPATTW